MNTTKDLRECPFCGGSGNLDTSPTGKRFRVKCVDCGGMGPMSDENRQVAIDLWNDREPEHQDPKEMGWVGQDGLP